MSAHEVRDDAPSTTTQGDLMHARYAATLAAALLIGGLVGCSSQPTQDEIATACVKALKARGDGDTGKPKDCEGLTEDNYTTLVMSQVLHDTGAVDDDGNVDVSKLLNTDAP
jgi:hypothetical protein